MTYTSFNDQNLLQQFKGDEEILLDMISIIQAELDKLLDPIRQAILTKDAECLRINAHTFKGIMSNFYADEGKKLAYELEKRGAQSLFNDALELLNKLEKLLQIFLQELNILKNNLSNHP